MTRNLELIEQCQKLSIQKVMKENELSKQDMFHIVQENICWEVVITKKGVPIQDQNIYFSSIPVHFGGFRYLFKCEGCGKSVQDLYLPESSGKFLCRFCHKVGYSSQYLKGGMYTFGFIGALEKRRRKVEALLDRRVRKNKQWYKLNSELKLLNTTIRNAQVKYLIGTVK